MTSTANSVGMEAREAGRNAPKPLPLEALERLKGDLVTCGSSWLVAVNAEDLRSLLSSYEAQGERLREVEGALSALAGSAERVRQMLDRDITRQGPDMRELGIPFVAAIHKAAALTQPPAVEKTDG